MYESFLRGNIIKYVMRAPYKGDELLDMRKAYEYMGIELARLEAEYASAKPVVGFQRNPSS